MKIKFFLSAFTMLFLNTLGYSQEKMNLNGVSYLVYPNAKIASPDWLLLNAIDREQVENQKWIFQLVAPEMAANETDYEDNFAYFMNVMLEENTIKLKSKSLKYIRANPAKFYSSNYNIHQTVTPNLDVLPDGKYVQLYDQYFTLDAKGNVIPKKDQAAGFFELKNNLLEGFAYWINPIGDTIEQGHFLGGKKTGTWKYRASNSFSELYELIVLDPSYDEVICNYRDGVLDGSYEEYSNGNLIFKGAYENNKESGEWSIYSFSYSTGKPYLKEHFTYANEEKAPVSHKPMIRNVLFERVRIQDSINLPVDFYNMKIDFNKFFDYYNIVEEDLELPEEKVNSYEGDEIPEYEFEEQYYGRQGKWVDGKLISRGKLFDSIGVKNNFTDVYEEFHQNGQLKFRYEFKNGDLVAETPIYWDNGVKANVIEYHPATKEYSSTNYDYDGKVISVELFDSIGDFKKTNVDLFQPKIVNLEGLPAKYYKESMYYEFNAYDTLKKPLNEKLTFYKSWYNNQKPCSHVTFDPKNREAVIDVFSINQSPKLHVEFTFGENYEFYSSKSTSRFKNLSLIELSNASYEGFTKNDSVPHAKIYNLGEDFEKTSDFTLYMNELAFSGDVVFHFNARKPTFNFQDNKLDFTFANFKFQEKLNKQVDNYLKTGKGKYKDLLAVMDLGQDYVNNILEFFPQLFELFYPELYNEMGGEYYEGEYPSEDLAKTMRVEGKFTEGKPSGLWKSLDQDGKIIVQINFENGEKQGESLTYNYAYPLSREDMEYFGPSIADLPQKKTYYLSRICHYNKDMLHGEEKKFDWKGNVTYSGSYKDGFLDGEILEKSDFVFTKSSYEEGLLDGIVRTGLTLPEKDTIILFDLNFQNHQLQGESKSYHQNGKLAKRGFFLNNEPIQDYEAFDSLGTKYHYIKFQYSFPVEEKIWEENELSIRYLFDWKDSIYFRPNDLVEVPSTYELLMQYGLFGEEYLEQPYYGRPSLIDKTGIKYHVTKYFPNQTVARDGPVDHGKKVGTWVYYNYTGEKLYEINYFDTILKINDSIKFKSKGIITDLDSKGNALSKSYIIEKIENYDCSHTDHYEKRQFYTIWQSHDSIGRMNGYVKNYYDDGTLQSEGQMLNGLPTGIWKYYTPNGQLNQVGEYVMGKRNGRWLTGDLSKTNYLGDICLNPNLPDLEKRLEYQENLLDIQIRYFKLGKIQKTEFYDVNLNRKNK